MCLKRTANKARFGGRRKSKQISWLIHVFKVLLQSMGTFFLSVQARRGVQTKCSLKLGQEVWVKVRHSLASINEIFHRTGRLRGFFIPGKGSDGTG